MVADSVTAVTLAENERVNNVSERFGHLLAVEGYPAVNSKVIRKRKIESHEHCRPDDRMETHDILGNHVNNFAVTVVCPVVVEVVVP